MPRRNTVLRSQAREMVYNVSQFMKKEAEDGIQINIKAVQRRTAAATGISEGTVRRICTKAANSSNMLTVFQTPGKKRASTRRATGVDNFVLGVIKRCIHNFPHSENELPTVKQLLRKLQEEINFQGSATSLRRILKDLGFCWKKTNDNRKVLIEKIDIRLKRIEYIESIKKYRAEGRLIVYTGESYVDPNDPTDSKGLKRNMSKGQQVMMVHAGSEYGFVPNALLMFKSGTKSDNNHDSMNYENYDKWIRTQLIPNLPPHSVIVVGNASYHNKQIDSTPTSNAKRGEMEEWLQKNGIPFNSSMLKPQLYKLIYLYKCQSKIYCIDQTFKEHNHTVLRLPPFHQDLNPLEMAWAAIKGHIAKKSISLNTNIVMDLVQEKTNLMGEKDWAYFCNKTRQLEQEYLQRDHIIDTLTDRVVIQFTIKEELESEKEMDGGSGEDSHGSNEESDQEMPCSSMFLVVTHEKGFE